MPTREARSGVRRGIREDASAVFNHCGGFLGLTIANVADLHFAADGGLRNRIDQIVAGLYRLTVYAGDDVATLQSGLFRRAAGLYAHDDNAVLRA
jgi:hypothetical protein